MFTPLLKATATEFLPQAKGTGQSGSVEIQGGGRPGRNWQLHDCAGGSKRATDRKLPLDSASSSIALLPAPQFRAPPADRDRQRRSPQGRSSDSGVHWGEVCSLATKAKRSARSWASRSPAGSGAQSGTECHHKDGRTAEQRHSEFHRITITLTLRTPTTPSPSRRPVSGLRPGAPRRVRAHPPTRRGVGRAVVAPLPPRRRGVRPRRCGPPALTRFEVTFGAAAQVCSSALSHQFSPRPHRSVNDSTSAGAVCLPLWQAGRRTPAQLARHALR